MFTYPYASSVERAREIDASIRLFTDNGTRYYLRWLCPDTYAGHTFSTHVYTSFAAAHRAVVNIRRHNGYIVRADATDDTRRCDLY